MDKTKLSLTTTVLLSSMFLSAQGLHFEKKIATTDTEYGVLFTPYSNVTVTSTLQCAIMAYEALENQNKAQIASSYKFDGQSCQLGQTPPFLDKIMENERIAISVDGVHTALNIKPRCPIYILADIVHADLYAYVLMNEQKYFNAHRNLPTPPNASFYDGVTKYFAFTMVSPVQTLEGQFAAQPMNNAYLQFQVAPTTFQAITVLLWYNCGGQPASHEPLVYMTQGTNAHTGIDFWAGFFNGGQLHCTLYPYPNNTLNMQTVFSSSALTANAWYYIGMGYDGNTGSAAIYINGKQDAALAGAFGYMADLNLLTIGYSSGYGYYLKNYMASVEVYDSFLTEAAVAVAMAKSTTTRVQL